MASSSEFIEVTTTSEKWVRAINWKASIPAFLATISFVLSLDGGPSCNFVVLQSPLLDRDQHFGLWYFLTPERVAPTYEMKNVCRLYQATADLGSMWEAARILWFISIIPCFIMTFALWRMLITPISKSSWTILIATCFLCCVLQIIIPFLFLYGHACYGNQMMAQTGTTCVVTTGSYIAFGAAFMWFTTLMTMGYFPPYLKQKNPKNYDVDHDYDMGSEGMGVSVSARKNGLIELQVCESSATNLSSLSNARLGKSSSGHHLDIEMAKTELAAAEANTQRSTRQVSIPPEIDDSFTTFIKKAEADALGASGTSISDSRGKLKYSGSMSSHSSKRQQQRQSSSDSLNNLSLEDMGSGDDSVDSLGRSRISIIKLEERFA